MTDDHIQLAKFSDDYKYIIDSEGQKVKMNDPRVMHILTYGTNECTSKMMINAFGKQGWKARHTGKITNETLQYARNLISGRECLPITYMVGAALGISWKEGPKTKYRFITALIRRGHAKTARGLWYVRHLVKGSAKRISFTAPIQIQKITMSAEANSLLLDLL